jgi:hypothetical protein
MTKIYNPPLVFTFKIRIDVVISSSLDKYSGHNPIMSIKKIKDHTVIRCRIRILILLDFGDIVDAPKNYNFNLQHHQYRYSNFYPQVRF